MFSSRFFRAASRLISRFQSQNSGKTAPPNYLRAAALATGVAVYSFSSVMCDTEHFKEIPVGSADDYAEGSMRRIQIGDNEENFILVSKVCGQFYATGGKCSHYGAPLQMGFLDGFSVICPWHAAAFDVRTGEMLHAPGVNAIPSYKIHDRNGKLFVEIPESKLNSVAGSIVSRNMSKRDPKNNETIVVVGGGAAGNSAVETLRREGFTGRVVLLTAEKQLPYDRIVLSKNFKVDSGSLSFRDLQFYQQHDIEVQTDAEVTGIESDKKLVKLKNGSTVSYDKLLLATGSVSKVPGPYKKYKQEFSNIFTIRSSADHTKLKSSLVKANNIVIIGAGFIGLESAKAIKTAWPEKNVTIISVEEKPFAHILGSQIAEQLINTHKLSGIQVISGQKIDSLQGKDGLVNSIVLPTRIAFGASPNTTELPTDLVILATGGELSTSYVPHYLVNSDGSVRVNSHLQTENSSIYAAGDIAQFPSLLSESRERLDHWSVAEQQGRLAALNMLGKGNNYLDIPFFWSNQFVNVHFAGFSNGHDWTYTETKGEDVPSKTARITYFFKGERCIGVAAINWPGAVLRLKIALHRGLMPSKADLVSKTVGYDVIAERVKNSNPCGANCCRR